MSNANDETRVPPPVPPTLSQAPDAPTPTFLPNNATAAQTPDQISSLLAASDRDPSPVVPGYEICSKLGAGGMGVVYRARELAFDRDVAVKVLKAKYPQHSPILRRFLEEARITAQLQHPAIPPVHHIGELADGRPFLAMKLIKGDTLADLLTAEGAVRGRYMPAFAQVCQAVAYAHAHKVIHRDLKPQNIMVGAFGEVLVMDWGLAKVLGAPEAASTEPGVEVSTEIRAGRDPDSETQAGSVLGTPAYMAPEQAAGEVDKVDERADVFGLGAVLCALLTGAPPYTGSGKDSVRVKAIRCDTSDAYARLDASGADSELIALCKRCLSRERDDRPRNASEVAKAIAAHLSAVEERARQAELERARSEARTAEEAKTRAETEARAAEYRKRHRAQRALTGSVLLLLAVVGAGAVFAHLWRAAESARTEADRLRGVAETGRVEESRLRIETERAKAQVEFERERASSFEYGAIMRVAHQEWRDGNLVAMRELLDGTNRKLRGWEWNYLNHLHDPSLLTLNGQAGWVNAASFSADGTRIVTASGDRTAKVWDAKTGTEALTLKGHTDSVNSASFSADGTRIVTASDDTAKVWDAKTGKEVLTLKGHTGKVVAASLSADGTRIVTGSEDQTAKVWDAKTGKEVRTLKGHTDSVTAASFSADGTRIVTGSLGKTKVWDAKTDAEVLVRKGYRDSANSASFSADGTRMLVASDDKTVGVWDKKTKEVRALKGHTGPVYAASFSADGTRIVTASGDRTAKVWDAKTGAEVLTLKGHTDSVNSASFSADGTHIVTANSRDDTVKIWDSRPFRDSLPPLPPPPVAPTPRAK